MSQDNRVVLQMLSLFHGHILILEKEKKLNGTHKFYTKIMDFFFKKNTIHIGGVSILYIWLYRFEYFVEIFAVIFKYLYILLL